MKRVLILIVIVGAVYGGYKGYRYYLDSQPYVPSAEFAEAYEAMESVENARPDGTPSNDGIVSNGSGAYDIEKTVRIMNSLEVAQAHCGSFSELLMYMAKQDYSGVAPEVLVAKKKIFPVLEAMNDLQKKIADASTVMGYLNAVTECVEDEVEKSGVVASMVTVCKGGSGGFFVAEKAFEAYKKQKKIKKDARRELEKINRRYIAYIEDYAPVYHKYMAEWNRLCLLKDKAYIDVYSGRYADALNGAAQILNMAPGNQEGMLLKSLALISLGPRQRPEYVSPADVELNHKLLVSGTNQYSQATLANPLYFTAERTLDEYLSAYPDRAAPALLLKGLLYRNTGNTDKAMTFFEQAAVEYPRQAEALTDILNSYNNRAYLAQSAEGLYLLNYYRSTMEGFGIFSPNFQKASLLAAANRTGESMQEIYKHFFRRSNQSVHHCLLSDMQYCENNLASSFFPLFLESSHIDIAYASSSKFLGMGSKKDKVDITVTNRSDARMENVRVFLCVHYTGMYTDDYEVLKIPYDKNVMEPYETVVFEGVDLAPHTTDQITRVRGIVMTDDKIGWADTPETKESRAVAESRKNTDLTPEKAERRERYMADLNLKSPMLKRVIAENMRINGVPLDAASLRKLFKGGNMQYNATLKDMAVDFAAGGGLYGAYSAINNLFADNDIGKLRIELPRILTLLQPSFTIHPFGDAKIIKPKSDVLAGEYIRVVFDKTVGDGETVPLYIYGNCISFRVDIRRNGDGYDIVCIDEI